MHFDKATVKRFTPYGNRILVQRHEQEVIGSIIIPEAYRTKDRLAKVVAVGPKVRDVKKGDVVLIPGCALLHPDFEEDEYALITIDDVGGVHYDN